MAPKSTAGRAPPVRIAVLTCALCIAQQGCVGSFAFEELVFDRDSRDGMVLLASDSALSVHAFEGSDQAKDATTVLAFLRQTLTLYISVTGRTPARGFAFYLHSPEHFEQEGDHYLPAGGKA